MAKLPYYPKPPLYTMWSNAQRKWHGWRHQHIHIMRDDGRPYCGIALDTPYWDGDVYTDPAEILRLVNHYNDMNAWCANCVRNLTARGSDGLRPGQRGADDK